jgi:hypothetical protein
MINIWNVKAIYPSGGHLLTDKSGMTLRFKSESAANDEAAMRKMNEKNSGIHYIVVPERI